MKKYIPTDQNTKDLLKDWTRKNGQNWELFLKYGPNNTITAKTLKQIENSKDTTFRSEGRTNFSNYPFLTQESYKETVFKEWVSSTFYQQFKLNSDGMIEMHELPRNTISYKEYEKIAIEKIEKNIKEFIDKNNDIVLMYSQGIDSILLMSYLVKYDAIHKTELVYVENEFYKENTVPKHERELFPAWSDRFKFEEITQKNKPLDLSFEETLGFKKITKIKLNQKTLRKWANSIDPFVFFNYQSYEIVDQFKDRPILIGYEGNSVLMHKWEWIRRIGKTLPIDENYYTNTVNEIDWEKPWDNSWNIITYITPKTRGWNCEAIKNEYSPISDSELMSMLPFIDTNTIDPLDIANATLTKKMIRNLVGNRFDHLIVHEGNNWINFWTLARIPIENLEPECLFLYVNKKSNLHNVSWCKKIVKLAKETGWIFAVDLMHLKYTNMLTSMGLNNSVTSTIKTD
jgi:hypothetical protein